MYRSIVSDLTLHKLSAEFNKHVPKDFYSQNVFVLDSINSPNKRGEGQYIRWTYATMHNKDIKVFAELTVFFEVDKQGEGVKFPKVLSIEVKSAGIPPIPNTERIIKEYQDRKAKFDLLPPLPR